LNAKVSDATLDDAGDARPPAAHTVASHSDTTATGAELDTLTDGSNADALHVHAGSGFDEDTILVSAGAVLTSGGNVLVSTP
jgi:hypothetical protein